MMNDLSSPAAYLASRRSAKARNLVAPGPSPTQLEAILTIAARTPDHGKLAPWRFVIVARQARDAFAEMLANAYRATRLEAGRLELEAIDSFARQAPSLVVVVSTPDPTSKIPLWEQRLSCGAAAMNLLHGAHAHGFAGNWLTGWAAFDPSVAAGLGIDPETRPDDRIAGFVFIGALPDEPEERVRPDLAAIVSHWPADR